MFALECSALNNFGLKTLYGTSLLNTEDALWYVSTKRSHFKSLHFTSLHFTSLQISVYFLRVEAIGPSFSSNLKCVCSTPLSIAVKMNCNRSVERSVPGAQVAHAGLGDRNARTATHRPRAFGPRGDRRHGLRQVNRLQRNAHPVVCVTRVERNVLV